MVSCAQWRIHGNPHGGGPTLLLNGVFLLTLIRTLHPRAGDASCLEDLSYYPTVHLSYVTSVVASHMVHQDRSRTRLDRSADPSNSVPICDCIQSE